MTALEQPLLSPIARDVYEGLSRTPKCLPPKLFYDDAGSGLFEEITRLPEYYLTRTELSILRKHARQFAALTWRGTSIVELGSGNAAKTQILLKAFTARHGGARYVPVDICPAALAHAKQALENDSVHVKITPVLADISHGFSFLERIAPPRLVLYIGSSIGNFNTGEAALFLRRLRRQLTPGDALLLGTDLVKDPASLIAAYNDSAGITAAFNRNVLARINRELGGHFDLKCFRHLAIWNDAESRIEMHLQSLRAQVVGIDALRFSVRFGAGETIHTENSHKYTVENVHAMLRDAGFSDVATWMDGKRWFAVHWASLR